MRFENTNIENQLVDYKRFTDLVQDLGFDHAGQWDYERVTYDRKFVLKEDTFYFRVQAYVTEGEIDGNHAVIKLMTPLVGKYYYPHGVEYGENEHFPKPVVDQCHSLIAKIEDGLQVIKM